MSPFQKQDWVELQNTPFLGLHLISVHPSLPAACSAGLQYLFKMNQFSSESTPKFPASFPLFILPPTTLPHSFLFPKI